MSTRTVLITGCSSGFGWELVPAFLERGWHVVATLRNSAGRGERFAELLQRYPGTLDVLSLDVTREDERQAALTHLQTQHAGRLDCLVNNAGYAVFGALEDLSPEQLRAQFEVNFFGTALLTRTLLPALRAARGRILNVSSVLGYHGMPLTSAYCGSKFALEGFSEALAHELWPHGVQVSLVEPGGHRTRFGENVQWADGMDRPGSPYALQSANYRALRARLAARRGVGSQNVVRVVLALSERSRLPLRVRVGQDARTVHLLASLLPQRLLFGLFKRLYGQVFLKPRPTLPQGGTP